MGYGGGSTVGAGEAEGDNERTNNNEATIDDLNDLQTNSISPKFLYRGQAQQQQSGDNGQRRDEFGHVG